MSYTPASRMVKLFLSTPMTLEATQLNSPSSKIALKLSIVKYVVIIEPRTLSSTFLTSVIFIRSVPFGGTGPDGFDHVNSGLGLPFDVQFREIESPSLIRSGSTFFSFVIFGSSVKREKKIKVTTM